MVRQDLQQTTPASEYSPIPPEVWDIVLENVGREDLQATALSLSRAVPQSNVSLVHLCRHVRVRRAKQLQALVVRLRQPDAATIQDAIRSFHLTDWLPDENVVAILLNKLSTSRITELALCLGPRWTPDALQEGLSTPLHHLQHLSLRFNLSSLVKNYDSFHKGQYFDTTLQTLASWPPGLLQSFSFVQDPPPDLSTAGDSDREGGEDMKFAQPIVLHRTTCISNFVSSQLARSLRHLRLRIPSRSVTACLTSDSTASIVLPGPSTKLLPHLELLDIATTFLQQGPGFKAFLARHHGVQHLILDRTGLLSFPYDAAALGKSVAAIGLTRAAEAHKAWRGLNQRKNEAIAAAQREGQGRVRSRYSRTSSSLHHSFADLSVSRDRLSEFDNIPSRMIILPPISTFKSICFGIDIPDSERSEWREAFNAGFRDGLDSVREHVDEKMGQLRRAEAKREMRPEGDGCFLRFSTKAEREREQASTWGGEDLAKLKDPFKLYCYTFGLTPATKDDVARLRYGLADSDCVFCTIPDCPALGGVAWHKHQMEDDWDPAPASEHEVGCGHLEARHIWS